MPSVSIHDTHSYSAFRAVPVDRQFVFSPGSTCENSRSVHNPAQHNCPDLSRVSGNSHKDQPLPRNWVRTAKQLAAAPQLVVSQFLLSTASSFFHHASTCANSRSVHNLAQRNRPDLSRVRGDSHKNQPFPRNWVRTAKPLAAAPQFHNWSQFLLSTASSFFHQALLVGLTPIIETLRNCTTPSERMSYK